MSGFLFYSLILYINDRAVSDKPNVNSTQSRKVLLINSHYYRASGHERMDFFWSHVIQKVS